MLTAAQKDHIVILKHNEHKNNSEIAKLVGVSRGSVISTLNSGWTVNTEFMSEYNKTVQESNNDLLRMIKSVRYSDIARDVISLFTKANMKKELESRGLRSLITLQGVMFDKGMAYEKLQLDVKKLNLQERTLELKERELAARIDNPDAFTTVTIINDVEEAKEHYKVKEKRYVHS